MKDYSKVGVLIYAVILTIGVDRYIQLKTKNIFGEFETVDDPVGCWLTAHYDEDFLACDNDKKLLAYAVTLPPEDIGGYTTVYEYSDKLIELAGGKVIWN